VLCLQYQICRFYFGKEQASKRSDYEVIIQKISQNILVIQNIPTIGKNTTELLSYVTKKDMIIYNTVWKTIGRFDYNDFVNLDNDSTVNKLYDNSEFKMYFLN
jgi:hypothetical protein